MKAIYILLLLKIFVLALMLDNPHEIDITGKKINAKICKVCHLRGKHSNYRASPSNFSIDNLETAGTDSETSDESFAVFLPISSSSLCLSCHDGVIAVSVNHQTTLNVNIDCGHPISIEYIEGNSKLRSKESIINNWDNAYTINDILVNEKVECVSCHNPHNKTNINYLRSTNTGSKLCITCHNQ